MKSTVANITTHIGISADAVHYHYCCRYKELSQLELCDNMYAPFDRISGVTINGTDLLRKVSEEEAEKLSDSPSEVLDMVEYGTIRFESVHQITEALRNQFPDKNLIITMHDSVKEYISSMLHEEYYRLYDTLTREQQENIIHHFVDNMFERYNDYYKRREFMCYIFRNMKQEEFVYEVKQLINQESASL